MSVISNLTPAASERGFALQRYLLLHSQHEALKERIDIAREASSAVSSPASSTSHTRRSSVCSSSPPTSQPFALPVSPIQEHPSPASGLVPSVPHSATFPTSRSHRRSSPSSQRSPGSRRSPRESSFDEYTQNPSQNGHTSPMQLASRMNPDAAAIDLADDELQMFYVNQQIKSTLTELLNCASVRGDRKYRMWIQTRLMDAEMELKHSRREWLDAGRRRGSEFTGLL